MAAITTAALGLGMAGYQMYQGNKQAKAAQRALNSYERQELDNAFKDISISTMGSDLLKEQGSATSAGLIDAARQGGSRSIIGAVPRVVATTNQINQEAAKMIDSQYINRDYAIAGDNARIEGITENRDNSNINALSSQVQAGKQMQMDGIMGAATSIAYGAKNIDFGGESKDGFSGSWNERSAQRIAAGASRAAGGYSNAMPTVAAPATDALPFVSTPYSMPKVSNQDFYGDSYMYDDMINKYSRF